MIYVMKFMFYSVISIILIGATGLYIAWNTDGKKVDFKDYCKTF